VASGLVGLPLAAVNVASVTALAPIAKDLAPFANEPVLELRRAPVRAQLHDAMTRLTATLPLRVPVMIGPGQRAGEELLSTDPGDPERVVAVASRATEAEVAAALVEAERGLRGWRAAAAADRAAALLGAAAWLRERRLEAAALEVRECAKPWPEADADVCEAIDFLEYYARGAIELDAGAELLQVPGERNEMRYGPRGVTAVISPWNFPLAIPCGMTAAALATGNAVVLKPAEQSPGCALMLVRALRAGGVPASAISLLPGEGDVGAALVAHPRVQTIAFTGSLPVGLEITRAAGTVAPGQHHIKRVVSELGGKNCVIVDSDADLDEAVPAIVSSAFVYAGQKCSAAARVLVHEAIADQLIERVSGAVRVLVVGQADQLGTDVPPVIERSAKERVDRYAALAVADGTIAVRVESVPDRGWFCAPTVAVDLPPDSAVLNEEIFGPLLAIDRVSGVEQACDVVDALPYALTGGLFARDPATVRYVRQRSPVGNLYVNRGITGAMVGRQPFGGNRLSGTGSKAGGPDYLRQFVEPHVVTENTMRHGLVV
jgi:RHH-type transcriptional regulator, proline utilization regulon repressor / proline dehydrogenase / delta 1-pyrroline-5-carboxylate dehydrogenase